MQEQYEQNPTESPVVGVFHNASDAEAAARELTKNAFAGDRINVACGIRDDSAYQRARFQSSGRQIPDVREWLRSTFREHTESELREYQDAVRDGKVLVGVNATAQMADTAVLILSHHSPIYVRRSDGKQFEKHLVACG